MKKVTIFIYAILLSLSFAQERVMLEGAYKYKWGDNETVLEAESLCYNMALRNMVESYQIFVASTTDLQNYEVRNDLIQTLSAGYLEDLTVVEKNIDKEKNEAYYKLRAYVEPVEFKRVLQQEVKRKLNIYKPKPIRDNEYFSVLRQWESKDKYDRKELCLIIQYKRSIGYSEKFAYDVTYYDSEGFPLDGQTIHIIVSGNKSYVRGTIRNRCYTLHPPVGTAYYEIW